MIKTKEKYRTRGSAMHTHGTANRIEVRTAGQHFIRNGMLNTHVQESRIETVSLS